MDLHDFIKVGRGDVLQEGDVRVGGFTLFWVKGNLRTNARKYCCQIVQQVRVISAKHVDVIVVENASNWQRRWHVTAAITTSICSVVN